MIKEILGDLIPDLGDIQPIDPGCGCGCMDKTARNSTYADAHSATN